MYVARFRSQIAGSLVGAAVLSLALSVSARTAKAQGLSGAVYVGTNQSTGNAVAAYRRAADGTLSFVGAFPTGGNGLGTGADPLASQGAVVLDHSDRLLVAVNAGSDDISLFAVDGDSLRLLDRVSSGGTMPVSITIHGGLVYVLNAGAVPNIAGFAIDAKTSHLVPLAGSVRSLTGGSAASPAEVSFSLNGDILMATEKGTQLIDTYTVDDQGYASGPISNHSSGSTPFGFEFTHRNLAIVSEAGPNALSSYTARDDGNLEEVTGSLQNGQAAVCWIVVTGDGRYAFTVNSATRTISSYAVSPEGFLTLAQPVAATTGSGSAPTDAALSRDSKFLYVRDGGLNAVEAFQIGFNGSLIPLGSINGIPPGAQGIAAR